MFAEDKATHPRTVELRELHQSQSTALNVEIEDTLLATAGSRETAEGATKTSRHGVLPHTSECLHNTTTHSTAHYAMLYHTHNVVRLAYTTGKVNGQMMEILLDSGVSCSAIRKKNMYR